MGCCHSHHCGPCWSEPYAYEPVERHPRRRRRYPKDEREDLRDYLRHLEEEMAEVRREIEELTTQEGSG